jgi:ankyrin repeat protein
LILSDAAAATHRLLQVVKEALEAQTVDVGDVDADGNTLLHMAASQGHKTLVKELLRRGADPAVTNFSGKKCYDLAHELNYWELGTIYVVFAGFLALLIAEKFSHFPDTR